MRYPPPLDSFVKGSFGNITFKKRLPQIITKVIDFLNKEMYLSENPSDEKRLILERVVKLKHSLYKLECIPYPLADSFGDTKEYNQFYNNCKSCNPNDSQPTWINLPWLPSECFFYRKLFECFQLSENNKDVDYFTNQKNDMYIHNQTSIHQLFKNVISTVDEFTIYDDNESCCSKEKFLKFHILRLLQLSLWGNKHDMSLSAGELISNGSTIDSCDEFEYLRNNFLLCDQLDEVTAMFITCNINQLHYILDNAGMELASDLCLIYFLLKCGITKKIYIHLKRIPWFVSDVNNSDFFYMLKQLQPIFPSFSNSFYTWLENGSIILNDHLFWVGPWNYNEMVSQAPDLYNLLSQGDMIIFKGDLNYRKLVCDLKWPLDTPFAIALCGFKPSPIVALRTLKSNTAPGVINSETNKTLNLPPDWMISGSYGVVQLSI